jgi:hypothetical protein
MLSETDFSESSLPTPSLHLSQVDVQGAEVNFTKTEVWPEVLT